jgi:hypothetical protein
VIQSSSPVPLVLGVLGLLIAAALAVGFVHAFRRGDARLVRLLGPVGAVLASVAVLTSDVSLLLLPLFPLVVLSPAPVAEVSRRVAGGRPFLSLAVYVAGGVLVLYGSLIALLYERTLGGASTSRPFVALVAGAVLALAAAANLWRVSARATGPLEARLP